MDIRFDKYLAENEDNELFKVIYYLYPERWKNIKVNNHFKDINNWSTDIKYLNDNGIDVSDEIKELPNNVGGIYFFFIKGETLPFLENYPAYIGRAKITDNQNIKKRCLEYYYEFFKNDRRVKIAKMISKWGNYLYLKYIALTDNELISKSEAILINGILPPFNDKIPIITFEESVDAF